VSPRGRIGRFGRVGRRPDHWSSQHERARTRAAERLEAPLPKREVAWLETHLADCIACRAIAEMYASDRASLRKLRDNVPEPPRDLWARTAARIEQEAARRARTRPTRSRRTSMPVLGTLSGLAVVAVVVVATAISGGFLGGIGQQPASSPPIALASQVIPSKSAIEVDAGTVHWLGSSEDGAFAYNVASIDFVCRHDRQPDCAPFEDGHAKRVTLAATPRFIFQSPVDDEAVVVGTDANGADTVFIVPLPTPDPTPEPTPDASATASAGSPEQPSASVETVPTDLLSLPAPESPGDSAAASLPNTSDTTTAEPSTATAVAIISGVAVVGRTAAYSADGTWFAFSARPADGSAGPDIYVWHVGDLQARALTTDHASVFASWIGGSLLGSRVVADPADLVGPDPAAPDIGLPDASPSGSDALLGSVSESVFDSAPSIGPLPQNLGQLVLPSQPPVDGSIEAAEPMEALPQSFLLDPLTGVEIALIDAEWQPAVDPSGLTVVAWQGTVGFAEDGLTAAPATGNLVIHPFHGPPVAEEPFVSAEPSTSPYPSPSASASPTLVPDPTASASDSSSPSPSATPEVLRDFAPQVVAAGPIADFDARWDDTGSWLAIWIADPVDPGLGRLSLLRFNPFTGLLDRPEGAPQDVTALPGFSIGFGRLAWVTPPGQGGEGSRIQIAAWTADEVGAIESIPVNGAIVVQ
jgi:hypothetical protein